MTVSETLLVVRALLATVFAVAGVSKLADLRGSRAAVAAFGAPERLAASIGVLLPVAELGVAAALLPAASARAGAMGAVALLAVFLVAIARSMLRGEAPECHCLGRLHSEPAGWRTLARNAVLLAAAAFVVVAGWDDAGPSATAWVGRLGETAALALGGGVVVGALAAGAAWAFAALLRQHGELLLRVDELESRADGAGAARPPGPEEGLPLGSQAPAFLLSGLDGRPSALDAVAGEDRATLLLFAHPGCSSCNALLPQVARWQREHADRLKITVITDAAGDDHAELREHGLADVLLDEDRAVSTAYRIPGVPAAVLLDEDLRIASGVAGGTPAITGLVDRAVRASPVPAG